VVIADLMPGRLDNHGTVRSGAAAEKVDALFGLKRAPFGWEEELQEERKIGYGDGYGAEFVLTCAEPVAGLKKTEARLWRGYHEPGLQAADDAQAMAVWKPFEQAEALPGAAALVIAKHGQGRTITLNFDFPNYAADRNDPKAAKNVAELKTLWAALLREQAGIAPKVELRGADKLYHAGVETVHYADSDLHLYGFINNRDVRIDWATLEDTSAAGQMVYPPRPVSLTLPTALVAFDVLNRKELGVGTAFQGEVPAKTLFYRQT
jgi:hypothetical protein